MSEYVPRDFFHHIKRTDRLKEFFVSRGIQRFPEITKKTSRKDTVDLLSDFYNSIPHDKKNEIEKAFAVINRLSTDRGMAALNDIIEINQYEMDIDEFLDDGLHDRSLHYYMKRPEIFSDALTISEFRDMSGWTRYPVTEKNLSFIKDKIPALQKGFEDIFRKESRGQYCFINGKSIQDAYYIAISFQSYPRVCSQVKDGEIDHLAIFRDLNTIYFVYLPKEAELHIKYHGRWQEKETYLQTFLKIVFGIEMEDMKRTYDLTCLVDKSFEINTDDFPDDVESWFLRSLKLRYRFSKKWIFLSMPPRDKIGTGTRGIWEMIEDLHLTIPLQREEIMIDEANFSIRFRSPESRGGIKSVPVRVNWTNKCSLGMIDDFERKASKILQKSGIDVGFNS